MADSPAPPPAAQSNPQEDLLRTAFVEMLFALAVGDVAIHAAEACQAVGWCREKLPAFSHLVLALVLMATSFVGWRQSQSPGMKERVKTVISWQFLGLLMDVLIVVEYFVLTELVEVKKAADTPTMLPASAAPEALACVVVFGTYAVWDLLTDIFPPQCVFPPEGDYPQGTVPPRTFGAKAGRLLAAVFTSVFASLCASSLAALTWWAAGNDGRTERVWLYDVALICVVVLFRLFKLLENWVAPWAGVGHLTAFRKQREVTARHWWALGVSAIAYLSLMLATWFVP
jgi:hypothetical protein